MSQRPNMPRGMRPPRVEWRAIAINDPEPMDYACNLQAALQMLADGGWSILSMYTRGPAQIILAQRALAEPPHPPGPIPGPTMPPPPPLPGAGATRMRAPAPVPQSSVEEQFVYHYLSPQGPQDKRFTSMVEALRVVREHIDGDGSCVPGYLVVMSVTTLEAPALLGLLKSYANDIAAQPPKQVD